MSLKYRKGFFSETPPPEGWACNVQQHSFTFQDEKGATIVKIAKQPEEGGGNRTLYDEALKNADGIIVLLGNMGNTAPTTEDDIVTALYELAKDLKKAAPGGNSGKRKIAFCLNRVEEEDDFKEKYEEAQSGDEEGRKSLSNFVTDKEFFMRMLREAFPDTHLQIKTAIKDISTKYAHPERSRYFVLSSCGYYRDNEKKLQLNLRPSGADPKKSELVISGSGWKPINVFPVFAWFLEDIEKKRLCIDDTPVHEKSMTYPERIIMEREKNYIPYEDLMYPKDLKQTK